MSGKDQDYGEWCEEQLKARGKEIKRLNTIINDAFSIANNLPELNIYNYTTDDVAALNEAMTLVWEKLREQVHE